MLVDRTYTLEELRAAVLSFGYRILSERTVQNGVQLHCDKGAILTCYDVGTVLPQGKGQDTIRRLLNEENTKLEVSKNRVLILGKKRRRDARTLATYLRPQAIVGIPIDLEEASLHDYAEAFNQHRPFCQAVVFIGFKCEFEKGGDLASAIAYFQHAYQKRQLVVISTAEIQPDNSCIGDIEVLKNRRGLLHEIVPDIICAVTARMDAETRRVVRTAMHVAA